MNVKKKLTPSIMQSVITKYWISGHRRNGLHMTLIIPCSTVSRNELLRVFNRSRACSPERQGILVSWSHRRRHDWRNEPVMAGGPEPKFDQQRLVQNNGYHFHGGLWQCVLGGITDATQPCCRAICSVKKKGL